MGSQPRLVSASRGAAVLGVSGFSTQTAVWQEIEAELRPGFNAEHGYKLPEREESAAMRWGNCFESAIIELAERARGKHINLRESLFAVKDYNFITCHIDGAYFPEGVTPVSVLHEGKTTSSFIFRDKWGEPGTDRVPREYQIQAQHQMICTGAEKVIVSVLVFPETPEAWEKAGWRVSPRKVLHDPAAWIIERFDDAGACVDDTSPDRWAYPLAEMGFVHQYTVPAKPSLQKMMVERYRKFWENHVIPGAPPEPENYVDIKRLFPEPKATLVVDERIERLLSEYSQINAELKDQEKRQDAIKTKVLDWARRQEGGAVDEDSAEALILRNGSGGKVGSFAKNKNGALVFRA
jgi:predicted phage-related endonuclease